MGMGMGVSLIGRGGGLWLQPDDGFGPGCRIKMVNGGSFGVLVFPVVEVGVE